MVVSKATGWWQTVMGLLAEPRGERYPKAGLFGCRVDSLTRQAIDDNDGGGG